MFFGIFFFLSTINKKKNFFSVTEVEVMEETVPIKENEVKLPQQTHKEHLPIPGNKKNLLKCVIPFEEFFF